MTKRTNFKIFNLFLSIIMVFSLAMISHTFVNAEGITKIAVSNNNPNAGEKITVNIEGTQSGDKMTIKFSDSLKLESATANHVTSGNSVTVEGSKTVLTFTCVSEGKADIIASGSQNQASSVKVNIAGSQSTTNTTDNSNQTSEETKPSATSQFTIDGVGYVLSDKFDIKDAPKGFEEKRNTVLEHDYKMASNGIVTLCYLKKAEDLSTKGSFFLFNESKGEPEKMVMIGDNEKYVILTTPDSIPNDLMQEATFDVGSQKVSGYSCDTGKDVYNLFFGVDESKSEGWFMVSGDTYKSISAKELKSLKTSDGSDKVSKKAESEPKVGFLTKVKDFFTTLPDNPKHMLMVLIPIFIILLIVFVVTLISKKDKYDDEEEFVDDEENDDVIEVSDITGEKKADDSSTDTEDKNTDADLAEDLAEEDEEDSEEPKLGFFARHRKAKDEENEWKKLSEMDLDDFSSQLRESVKEIEENEMAESQEETEARTPHKEKEKIDFMDLNNL